MRKAVLGWLIPLVALLVLGPLATLPLVLSHGPDGSRAHTLLIGSAPAMGAIAWVLTTLAALLAAWVGARAIGAREGWLAGALVLLWGAFRTGDSAELVLAGAFAAPPLVVEGIVAVVSGLLVVLVAGGARGGVAELVRTLVTPAALVPVGVSLCAGVVACTVLAREVTMGQALFAAAGAGVAAGVASRLLSAGASDSAVALRAVAGACVIAAIAPIYMALAQDAEGLLHAGRPLGIASVTPVAWAAGVLLGVPIGMQWAGSAASRHGS